MKATLIRELSCVPCKEFPNGTKPAGTVIDHPQAFRLVQNGVAIPDDDECRERAGYSEMQMKAAQLAYEKVSKGIHPEDYDAYDGGLFDSYDAQGRPTLKGAIVTLPRQKVLDPEE